MSKSDRLLAARISAISGFARASSAGFLAKPTTYTSCSASKNAYNS